jgi:PIN domain nuclease of toxin-antitoxin system
LTRRARGAIADPANECWLSAASVWELGIKVSLGKLKLGGPLEPFVGEALAANGFALLGIEVAHVARVAELEFHHRDPFDRLLAAQSLVEGLALVSADSIFKRYGVRVVW